MKTTAVTFLFDPTSAKDDFWYGAEFDSAFLAALSVADPQGLTHTTVCRGDAIVSELVTKTTAVSSDGRGVAFTQSHDMDLYRTVIWDLADAIQQQWNTVDEDAFPLILGSHGLHCISCPTLPAAFAAEIDRRLRCTQGYVGAIEIDLGNPIQRTVFERFLIKDAVIVGGQVVLELSWDGDTDTLFEGAGAFLPRGERRVKYGELAGLHPKMPEAISLSERGAISLERYEGKRRFSLQERVAAALSRAHSPRGQASSFAISTTVDLSDPLEANLPQAKFIRYLLDENHPQGGSKAVFFRTVLGILASDWRYLAAQFHDGLKTADLTEARLKTFEGGFGISFNAVISIKGLNGETAAVKTNWIMQPGQQPRLSTAYPTNRSEIDEDKAAVPPVVTGSSNEKQRWADIHRLATQAAEAAAAAVVPTPMRVQGFGIEMEGLCGYAWVWIKDARRGFAKWAITNGHGSHHYKSGAHISAKVNSQSIDRAKAYAMAYAAVLRHNGIDCEVDSRLD